MITKPGVASAAVGLAVVTAVVVYAVTDNQALATACDLGVAIGACVGAWIGAERAQPGHRLVPRLIATGISLSMLGHVLLGVLGSLGAETDVSIADLPWLISYVVFCAAMWIALRRTRQASADRIDVDFLVDALTVVVVTVLIIWSISVDAIAADDSVPPFTRMVWAAYPLASAVLFALVMRVLMSRSGRAAIGVSFAVSAGLVLAANLLYLQAPEGGAALVLMNAAWMLAPAMAAWSVWRIKDIRADSGAPAFGWSLTLAIGPLFVPAALELVADVRGQPDQPLELFIGVALLGTLAFVRTARLIRSERRARLELEKARDVALEASTAKSVFLANMSHELRTPLTTVIAASEMLEDTPLDEVQLGLLSRMHRSGDRLKGLIEGILDFSRIEAGQLELTYSRFDLHSLVADAADPYGLRAIEAGIWFRWDLDPRVPTRVLCDPNRLFQVLTNVLDNAMKFTHQGQVRLDVRPTNAHTDQQDGGAGEGVEFVVEDTGIGICEADQKSVFESFSQVDGSMTRRYGGNGLGLAICRELVELMGGTITVQSQLGVGSTFVIRIPVTPGLHAAVPSDAVPLPV